MSHDEAVTLDPEELAAYIDGRLSGSRKAQVEATLAHDEESYEVFLESVRALEAEGLLEHRSVVATSERGAGTDLAPAAQENAFEPIDLEPLPANVVTLGHRGWMTWRRVGTTFIAGTLMAALLAVVLGLAHLRKAGTPAQSAMRIDVRELSPSEDPKQIGDVLVSPGWRVFRSAAPEPSGMYSDESVAFRLGVRSVDLRVAEQVQDPELLEQLTKNTSYWASSADLFASELVYEDLGAALESGVPEDFGQRLGHAEKEMTADVAIDPLMKRRYRAGVWAETGRLAARTRNAEALRARTFRWQRVGLAAGDRLRDEAAAQVAAIKQQLKQKSFSDADFATLDAAFERLIRQLAG